MINIFSDYVFIIVLENNDNVSFLHAMFSNYMCHYDVTATRLHLVTGNTLSVPVNPRTV